MAYSQLDIIPSYAIDAAKWDACIRSSEAGKLYATHLYLRHLADNWSGLVLNEYAAVMPVVWRKKWGIRYAYVAPFIQQLGLFGCYTADDLNKTIKAAMQYCKYGDLYVNHTNDIQPFLPAATPATNLVIPLQNGYESISRAYHTHLKNKLRKAAAPSLQCSASNDIELAVRTYEELYAQRFLSVNAANYQRLIQVAKALVGKQQCFIRKVTDRQSNLLAIALFFKDENRIYNILPSTTALGRKLSAMHFLLDSVIKEFAGQPLILDFEGSDIPGIKAFYQSFGAVNEPYLRVHYNLLPVPLRWLKR